MTDTVDDTQDTGNGNPPPKKPPVSEPAAIDPVAAPATTAEGTDQAKQA